MAWQCWRPCQQASRLPAELGSARVEGVIGGHGFRIGDEQPNWNLVPGHVLDRDWPGRTRDPDAHHEVRLGVRRLVGRWLLGAEVMRCDDGLQ